VGTDIHGWVECWDFTAEHWTGVIKLHAIIANRNPEVFAWLFGVRWNADIPLHRDLPPVAAERGLPADVSYDTAHSYAETVSILPKEYFGATWVSLAEVQAIDWDQPIEERITASQQGQYPFGTQSRRSEFVEHHPDLLAGPADMLRPGMAWTMGDMEYTVDAMRRRDALKPDWQVLFRMMDALATRWTDGSSFVRLVVWFGI
jgi:hypothetical protein